MSLQNPVMTSNIYSKLLQRCVAYCFPSKQISCSVSSQCLLLYIQNNAGVQKPARTQSRQVPVQRIQSRGRLVHLKKLKVISGVARARGEGGRGGWGSEPNPAGAPLRTPGRLRRKNIAGEDPGWGSAPNPAGAPPQTPFFIALVARM